MKKYPLAFLLMTLCCFDCRYAQPQSQESPFEYREVYLPEQPYGLSKENRLNSVDLDWGIWGHNLSVVLPRNASQTVYAKSGNSVNNEQFCFSSDMLFSYICDFIDDNYGRDKTMRFAILPNDNQTVCMCAQCTEHGNSAGNASGALYYLLERLTAKYPKHLFFTSYYRTAQNLPDRELPDNAGVLISAISYPLSPAHTPQEEQFRSLLDEWAGYTKHIYVWDYINNFDDYFTPYPVLDVVQHRLRMYADAGVKGVFFNGSGPDYSSMARLKAQIIAELFRNPDADWRPLLRKLCNDLYPVTGDMICDFMIHQEDMVRALGRPLPMYEGICKEAGYYFEPDEFVEFHDRLISRIPAIKDPERTEVHTLSRAMMLTRLELMRVQSDTVGSRRMLAGLERLSEQGIKSYSEAGGTIDSYVSEYRYMLRHIDETGRRNKLRGVRLSALTALDEDYSDISILTDGMLGLPSSYHCGQLISSADPALRIAVPNKGLKRLRVYMTRNAIYHIALPLSISLSVDGREVARKVPKPLSADNQRSMVEFDIPSGSNGSLVLTVVRNKEDRTMALDEIEGF